MLRVYFKQGLEIHAQFDDVVYKDNSALRHDSFPKAIFDRLVLARKAIGKYECGYEVRNLHEDKVGG